MTLHTHIYSVDELPWRLKVARWIGHQRWIPRGRDRLIRLLHDAKTPTNIAFEVDFFGLRYRGSLQQYLDCMVLFYGSYERPVLALLDDAAAALRDARGYVTYFDMGANLGHHALFMAPRADRVLAFEPYPPLQDAIRSKISQNGVTNVELIPFALGEADEVLSYHPGAGSNSGAGTFLEGTSGASEAAYPLQVRHAGRLMGELGGPRLDLIKIDVEGFEAPVLRSLKARVLSDRPIIVMELGERTKRLLDGWRDFQDLFGPDVQLYRVDGRQSSEKYTLSPLDYGEPEEIVVAIIPDEMVGAFRGHLRA